MSIWLIFDKNRLILVKRKEVVFYSCTYVLLSIASFTSIVEKFVAPWFLFPVFLGTLISNGVFYNEFIFLLLFYR